MEHFPRVDVAALADELEVKQHASQEGRRDRPERADSKLDSHQRAIVGSIDEMLNEARRNAEEQLNTITVRLGGVDPASALSAVRNLPIDTEMQIERAKGDFHDRLVTLRQHELEMIRELNYFQTANDLHRIAEYPRSDILHWAVVGALVLIESIANSFFFAGGSDLGLIGGALQAMLISCVNIGAALLSGMYAFRNMHHVNPVRHHFAAAGTAAFVAFMIFFNFATAHYRAQLGIDPVTAIVKALASLFRNPFAINDFDATVLLCVGIIFSIAAALKGYMADDRYPGFGQRDRDVQDARYDYQLVKQELRAAINKVVDKSRDLLHDYVEGARRESREFAALVAKGETLVTEYQRHTAELRQACHALLNLYRTTNRSVRTSAPPPYFNDYPSTDVMDGLPSEDLIRHRERAGDVERVQTAIDAETATALGKLKNVNAKALQDCEIFFKSIEEEALEKFSLEPNVRFEDGNA